MESIGNGKKIYINFANASKCLELDVDERQTVGEVKKIVVNYFKIDLRTTLADKSIKQIVLEYSRCNQKLNLITKQ